MLFRGGINTIMRSYLKLSSRKEECVMKRSKLIAVLLVSVMVIVAVQPAFAGWSGEKEVKKQAKNFGKAIETVNTARQAYDTAEKLYKAKDNDERKKILTDTAKDVGKGIVKAPIKAAADATITTGATSTAVYLASAAGVTAKTGTAIATLSGAAATNATLAAIGTPVATTLGIAAAPAVVGAAVVGAAAAGVCYGVHCLIDWIW